MQSLHAIIKPVVTEKATSLGTKLTYCLWVNRKATKIDVKHAVKEIYGADVESVRIINTPVKRRMLRKSVIDKRPRMKKAFITLKGGKKLDVTKIGVETKSKSKQ